MDSDSVRLVEVEIIGCRKGLKDSKPRGGIFKFLENGISEQFGTFPLNNIVVGGTKISEEEVNTNQTLIQYCQKEVRSGKNIWAKMKPQRKTTLAETEGSLATYSCLWFGVQVWIGYEVDTKPPGIRSLWHLREPAIHRTPHSRLGPIVDHSRVVIFNDDFHQGGIPQARDFDGPMGSDFGFHPRPFDQDVLVVRRPNEGFDQGPMGDPFASFSNPMLNRDTPMRSSFSDLGRNDMMQRGDVPYGEPRLIDDPVVMIRPIQRDPVDAYNISRAVERSLPDPIRRDSPPRRLDRSRPLSPVNEVAKSESTSQMLLRAEILMRRVINRFTANDNSIKIINNQVELELGLYLVKTLKDDIRDFVQASERQEKFQDISGRSDPIRSLDERYQPVDQSDAIHPRMRMSSHADLHASGSSDQFQGDRNRDELMTRSWANLGDANGSSTFLNSLPSPVQISSKHHDRSKSVSDWRSLLNIGDLNKFASEMRPIGTSPGPSDQSRLSNSPLKELFRRATKRTNSESIDVTNGGSYGKSSSGRNEN